MSSHLFSSHLNNAVPPYRFLRYRVELPTLPLLHFYLLFLPLFSVICLILLIACRSLEGVLDDLRSDQLVDGVAIQNLPVGDSDDEYNAHNTLPGANGRKTGGDGSRSTRQTVLTSSIRFSPTGREWAAATTQVRMSNENHETRGRRLGHVIS